jgi:tripartite-type tricarboxylate transporter receptor subunit TctC
MAEAGVKGVEMSAWYGIYMPASTPKAVQERVHAEVTKVLAMPETRKRLDAIGAEITPMTQAQFAQFHNAENKRYGELIQKNIKLDEHQGWNDHDDAMSNTTSPPWPSRWATRPASAPS